MRKILRIAGRGAKDREFGDARLDPGWVSQHDEAGARGRRRNAFTVVDQQVFGIRIAIDDRGPHSGGRFRLDPIAEGTGIFARGGVKPDIAPDDTSGTDDGPAVEMRGQARLGVTLGR